MSFSNNVATLGGSYDTAVQGIQNTYSGNVQALQTSFDGTVNGLVSGLEGNYALSEAAYSAATTGHYNTSVLPCRRSSPGWMRRWPLPTEF